MSDLSVAGGDEHHARHDFVSSRRKRAVIVVANPATNQHGWPVGFWAAGLTHPYYEQELVAHLEDTPKVTEVDVGDHDALLVAGGQSPMFTYRDHEALRERGANYVSAGLFKPFAIRDGRLVTGQQQYSGRKVAQVVLETLRV